MTYLLITSLICAFAVAWFIVMLATRAERNGEPRAESNLGLKLKRPPRPRLLTSAPKARKRVAHVPAPAWVEDMTTGQLAEVCLRLLSRMGYSMLSQQVEGDLAQVAAADVNTDGNHRVLMRAYARTAGRLGVPEIKEAVEAARDEGVNKAILVSIEGFDEEAEQFAQEEPIELLDGAQFAELARLRMPELLAEEFRPRHTHPHLPGPQPQS
jgi:hypothetical protein